MKHENYPDRKRAYMKSFNMEIYARVPIFHSFTGTGYATARVTVKTLK